MKMRYLRYVFVAIILLLAGKLYAQTARNVILLISDGCGYNHIDAASIYQYGKTDVQTYEFFPVRVAVSPSFFFVDTQGTQKIVYDPDQAWTSFDYVTRRATDSAAAATAISAGVATVKGAIGVDRHNRPLEHITQYAEKLGKATGVVTSVPWSHATPAGFMAHNASRGKTESIAQEMLVYSTSEVIMGCGHPLFDNDGQPTIETDYVCVGGEGIWEGLAAQAVEFDMDNNGTLDQTIQDIDGDSVPDPWTCIQTCAEFQALMVGSTPKRLLGIPQIRSTLQVERKGQGGESSPQASTLPFAIPFVRTVPTLAEMTRTAINTLDEDPDGFFLMIEGGAVDWAAHGHDGARMIEEEIDFNLAVEAAIQWIEENSSWEQTLLIVTSDHETGYLTGPGSGPSSADSTIEQKPVWNPLLNNGAGTLPGMEWHHDGHTCSLVPLFARGPGSDRFHDHIAGTDPVRGSYIENTAIGTVMREAFGQKSP